MKKSCLLILSLFGLCLLNGCGGGGGGGTTPSSATATHFSVTAQATATAGTAFSFTVTTLDASNNVATSYSGTVHVTSTDGQAVLPVNSTVTNGTATFSATLKTGGGQTITATDMVKASITGTSNSIIVVGPATHFSVTTAAATATAGTAFNFTVTALDALNNMTTGYSGTAHFTSTDGQAMLPANSTLANGTTIFSATLKTVGSQTITATDTVTASITGTSNPINVSASRSRSSPGRRRVGLLENATTCTVIKYHPAILLLLVFLSVPRWACHLTPGVGPRPRAHPYHPA